jgi:hypothetical protein
MTQSIDPAFPPFTERPPAQEVWRRVRDDYLAGDTAPVLAERYGVSERSVRRRASVEGWRRCDVAASVQLNEPPAWSRPGPVAMADFVADNPEYQAVVDAREADALALLFTPSHDDFSRIAFRRAAEGAAMGRPAEATAWLRVLSLLDRCPPPMAPAQALFPDQDHLRAAMLRALARLDDAPEDTQGDRGA